VAALDGLRGLALLGMLAWHAEVGWVRGGFARMTIFFTLSGYLAARSFLRLRDRSEPTPFRTFWRRRARRLLPVTVLGLVAAVAVTLAVGSDAARGDLRGDTLSVALFSSNWRFLLDQQSYGELFEHPSAFQHYWSLSLEEQLFWILPATLALAFAIHRRRAWIIVAGMAVAFAAIPFFIAHSPDAAYYGTHVRAGEFLAGVALAIVLHRTSGVPTEQRRLVGIVGTASLVLLVGVMLLVDREHAWLYQGGMGLFAIPAVGITAAAMAGLGPASKALGIRPLATIGRWAFPIYVLHWPLFILLAPERTGLDGTALIVVEMSLAIAIGGLVHRWFERPLMEGPAADAEPFWQQAWAWWSRDRAALGAVAGAAAVLVLIAALAPVPTPTYDLLAAEDRLSDTSYLEIPDAERVLAETPPRLTESERLLATEPLNVALFGGSTAVSVGPAGIDWSTEHPGLAVVPGYSRLGCGMVTDGVRVHAVESDGSPKADPPDAYCQQWPVRWSAAVMANDVDVAVVMTGVWETADWQLGVAEATGDEFVSIGDPVFDAHLTDRLVTAMSSLRDRGATVVLTTTPVVGTGADGRVHLERNLGPDHPARVAAYNDLLRRVAAETEGVELVEYGAWVDALTPEQRAVAMPDGIHPTRETADRLWLELLGPAVDQALQARRNQLGIAVAAPAPAPAGGPTAPAPSPGTPEAGTS
jgi:peptidoglycan/LPS O-acetylase OafA/YrhL